jgi:hypothetical protein
MRTSVHRTAFWGCLPLYAVVALATGLAQVPAPPAPSVPFLDASPNLKFDVASVKASTSKDGFIRLGGGPGQYQATNVPLRLLIQQAFLVQPFQLIYPAGINAGAMPMQMLAQVLSQITGRIVQDRTGLTGQYQFDLTYTPDRIAQSFAAAPPPGAPTFPAVDPNGPSIYTALQEQLGLKLDSTRSQVDVVVIDSVDRPTEN